MGVPVSKPQFLMLSEAIPLGAELPMPPHELAPNLELAAILPAPALSADSTLQPKADDLAVQPELKLMSEFGSTGLPTVGSAGHLLGTCKPCAFLHTKGCSKGPECEFCHLCDSGERKRRQKEKKEQLRELTRA